MQIYYSKTQLLIPAIILLLTGVQSFILIVTYDLALKMCIVNSFLSSNLSFFFFCRFMYPLTWGKNGSFCRNEFQKTIYFGKKSVIFKIKKKNRKSV